MCHLNVPLPPLLPGAVNHNYPSNYISSNRKTMQTAQNGVHLNPKRREIKIFEDYRAVKRIDEKGKKSTVDTDSSLKTSIKTIEY